MGDISYNDSYKLAVRRLQSLRDLEAAAKRCSVILDGKVFIVPYLQKEYRLDTASGNIEPDDLNLEEQILIFHYLVSTAPADDNPELVTFAGLPGGMFYYPTYRKRGPNRVLKAFGNDPDAFFSAAERSGGRKTSFGDASASIRVLPEIEFTVVLHLGDEEFPPEAQFLLRKDITAFLPLEDVAVLGGIIAARLQRAAG